MLLGKLCERKDKTALMYMHSSTAHYSPTVRNAKINLQNNTHNIASTTHPNLSFYLRETYRICNFPRTVVITPVNNTKHQFPFHRKFMKHHSKKGISDKDSLFTDGPYINETPKGTSLRESASFDGLSHHARKSVDASVL